MARQGEAGNGMAWRGFRLGVAGRGMARRGGARYGVAWFKVKKS